MTALREVEVANLGASAMSLHSLDDDPCHRR
jgi:hypothetical protein